MLHGETLRGKKRADSSCVSKLPEKSSNQGTQSFLACHWCETGGKSTTGVIHCIPAGQTVHVQRSPKSRRSSTTAFGFVRCGESPGLRIPAARSIKWGSFRCCPHPQRPYLPPAVLTHAQLRVNKSFTGGV